MASVKAGIVGGAGYTAGELLRILIHHPSVEVGFVHSNSNADKPIHAIHTDLIGETDVIFTGEISTDIDVLFLCSGHGQSKAFLAEHDIPDHIKIIDLSHDFRLKDDSHSFVYGLPELQKAAIQQAKHIANPGCFATCIQLALLPLAKHGLLKEDVHINAITGSTGAGQKPTNFTHFSWRNNNVSIYKAFKHQHLAEIGQSITSLQDDFSADLNFIPVRGDFTRGILASVYTKIDHDLNEMEDIYDQYYSESPFVFRTGENPSLKQVVNTNKGLVYLEKHDDKLLIVSMIDNLLKGASGQAVQNMNLIFGLDERTGLQLKGSAF
ncbi:MAG: N-acetyl-gamma-glutamyl-phosphate reductase [Bacteroidota bacterium]